MGYIGIRTGQTPDGATYAQYQELFVPEHERFRFMYQGGRLLREAPHLTAPYTCPVHQATVVEPEPTPTPEGRTCLRCDNPVAGRRKVCESCRTPQNSTT